MKITLIHCIINALYSQQETPNRERKSRKEKVPETSGTEGNHRVPLS
jgi:hypothetical protein